MQDGRSEDARTLEPFGLEVTTAVPGAPLETTDAAGIAARVSAHRVVVLRGVATPSTEAMLAFCRRLGEPLEWDFGAVNELAAREDARNYLYTRHEVPFHWDGAFVGRVPRYIFFCCAAAPAPGAGGETLFCDTTRLLARADDSTRARWQRLRIRYATERVAHYGGEFTAAMVDRHPVSGETVVRFAEPVADLNPVRVAVAGLGPGAEEAFLAEMHARLRDPAVCYVHAWRDGDIVLADNHALLHGRRAYAETASRHLRRVNIL